MMRNTYLSLATCFSLCLCIYAFILAGRTLKFDPRPQFGVHPTSKAQFTDISLERVLCDLQDDEEYVKTELGSFAAVGFARSGEFDSVARMAYQRGHVYSAVVLNVRLLHDIGVTYDPRLHLWEDLDFNERLNTAGDRGLIAKCQRYLQVKRTITGGTDYMVARPDEEADDAVPSNPPPQVHPPVTPEPVIGASASELKQLIDSAELKKIDADAAVELIEDEGGDVEVLLSFDSSQEFNSVLTSMGLKKFDVQRLWKATQAWRSRTAIEASHQS